jgi:hypothetical protein
VQVFGRAEYYRCQMNVCKIVPIKMDRFHVSVKQSDHRQLRGKPVIVASSRSLLLEEATALASARRRMKRDISAYAPPWDPSSDLSRKLQEKSPTMMTTSMWLR